jgi:hypothetical protein
MYSLQQNLEIRAEQVLPGSKGEQEGERGGRGQRGEIAYT